MIKHFLVLTFIEVPVNLAFGHERIKWRDYFFEMIDDVGNEFSTVESIADGFSRDGVNKMADGGKRLGVPNRVVFLKGWKRKWKDALILGGLGN